MTVDPGTPEDETLTSARARTRECRWLEAAKLFHHALETRQNEDPAKRAEITELLAECQFEGAFQSSNRTDFCKRMQLAREAYEAASSLYKKADPEGLWKASTSKGMFASFWLENQVEARRHIVDRCISLADEALQVARGQGNVRDAARIQLEILTYSREALHLTTEWRPRYREFLRTLEVGRKSVEDFESLGDDEGLTSTLHLLLWMLSVEAETTLEYSEFLGLADEIGWLARKLADASRRLGTARVLAMADEAAADVAWDLEGSLSKAYALYQKALKSAVKTENSLTIGRLFAVLATLKHWTAMTGEIAEERREAIEQGLKFANEAIRYLGIPLHTSYLARAYTHCAGCYMDLTELVETDPGKKRAPLDKAIEMASKGIACEDHTVEWQMCAHTLSKAMYFLAISTETPRVREQLLTAALPIRQETVRVSDSLQPHSWNRGVMRTYLALIKAELASVETDKASQSRFLSDAVSHMEDCLVLCREWEATVPGSQQRLALYSEWHGDILQKLFRVKPDRAIAERTTKAYLDAIDYLSRHKQVGPIPAIRWKIAKVQDAVGDFKNASETFAKASEEYSTAAREVPGGGPAFKELSTYMDAWARIEMARLYHAEENYDLAFEHYSKAAEELRETTPWKYLADITAARSSLERAEEHSHQEKHEASKVSLSSSLDGFRQARADLEARLKETPDRNERRDLENWLTHVGQREMYCLGRIQVEEAKAIDKKGDKAESSRKFRSASEIFKRLEAETSNLQDREEIETLVVFCDSWAMMKMAESKLSPELFAQAAESFAKVGEISSNQTPRLLALANASICRALESGTRFRLTRDTSLYSDIKKRLETAADYYTEAGFKKTGSWTRATQRLFDALVFLGDAEVEKDPRKKTELYQLGEKHLELAARLYGEAGFPSKQQETLEQLERTREEKETLLETLRALAEIPTASTALITSIPPSRRQAPGLERFEDANLAGEVQVPPSVVVGSDFTLVLDMVNVGKTPATLVKLENVVPEGLQQSVGEGQSQLQGNTVDLKGKRLEYLKTHTFKISLRTSRKGSFDFQPRIVFVDDKGRYRSYQFLSTLMTIREPGISEYTGPSTLVSIPAEFQFEDERSREVFRHLVKVFADDYMSRRIVEDKAGWRTMMEIIEELKIPRSSFYGPEKKTGPVLLELERKGLVETRVFPGERGRGGDIRRVRVAFENTIVRGIVEKAVMQNK